MGQPQRPHAAVHSAAAHGSLILAALAALVCIAGLVSCGKTHRQQLFNENLLPTMGQITARVDTSITHPDVWNVEVAWVAQDADGAIDHIEYAIDPTAQESVWVSTTANPLRLVFPVKSRNASGYLEPEYHVLAIRARDDRNEVSPVVSLALYAGNLPPSVRFVSPQPSPLLNVLVPPGFSVSWSGDDPDGYPTRRPASYRVRTVLAGDPDLNVYRAFPDSLLRQGEGSGWEGWTQYDGDLSTAAFPDLPLTATGLIAVVAFDTQGAHSGHSSLTENVLQFTVDGALPAARFQSALFDITVGGGIAPSPGALPLVDLPGGQPLELHWDSHPLPGSRIVSTRWVLDPADLADTTTRAAPADVHHWSPRIGSLPASALLGPFIDGGSIHTFWLEIADDVHRSTLTGLRFFVVPPRFDRDLLVVDDTRLEVDKYPPTGCPFRYTRPWPSAAELDTFLYARGGVPWRCLPGGVDANSVPGLLDGYSFDTLGTRRGLEDPAQAVTLATLSGYRHVLWLVDGFSAQFADDLDQRIFPVTALRAMAQPGHVNVLAAYASMGGRVWLAGGGAAYATLIAFDLRSNNVGGTIVFKNEPADHPELGPGRLLYDDAHLRSAISVTRVGGVQLTRSAAARGGWSGHGMDGTLSAPDYSRLPAQLRLRDPSTDPLPPTRSGGSSELYYPTSSNYEYVSAPNIITEDMDPDPTVVHLESTLDTLVDASGAGLTTAPAPVMTYYHGRDNAPFVFSGIDLWSWSRSDAQALVDFMLGDVWGLTRAGPQAAGSAAPSGATGSRWPGTRGADRHRLDPPRARP